jgi:acyl-CoA thioesterase-1
MTSQSAPVSYRLFRPSRQTLFATVLAALLCGRTADAAPARILVFGDSLSAGFGLRAQEALPAQLETRLRADGFDVRVVNAGVSGDTTANGLARLDYTLESGPFDVAIIELGANDMLRGIDPKIARDNLDRMITSFRSKGATVMLATMAAGENWGQAYKKEFDSIYPELAAKHEATLIPFMMSPVWGEPKLLIGDGLHPNPAGVAKMVEIAAPPVEKLLGARGFGKSPAGAAQGPQD